MPAGLSPWAVNKLRCVPFLPLQLSQGGGWRHAKGWCGAGRLGFVPFLHRTVLSESLPILMMCLYLLLIGCYHTTKALLPFIFLPVDLPFTFFSGKYAPT